MTTATTNTVIDHTSDAGYRTWIAELITQFLAVGLTQTSDTGQVNTATVTRPGTNTLNAYAIFRFNDTAHSTNPIFFKIDFGTGTGVNNPQMRITVGRGSNGSGTINGLTLTRVGINAASTAIASTITSYISRFMYDANTGVFWFAWKIGSIAANTWLGGVVIYRSNDEDGVVTTDSTMVLSNNSTDTAGGTGNATYAQVISHLSSTAYGTAPFPNQNYGAAAFPFALTSSLYSGDAQVSPIYQYTPRIGITIALAVGLVSEFPLHGTVSMTLLGSTAHTYIAVNGTPLGSTATFMLGMTPGTHTMLLLWE